MEELLDSWLGRLGILLGIFCLGFGILVRKVYKLVLRLGT